MSGSDTITGFYIRSNGRYVTIDTTKGGSVGSFSSLKTIATPDIFATWVTINMGLGMSVVSAIASLSGYPFMYLNGEQYGIKYLQQSPPDTCTSSVDVSAINNSPPPQVGTLILSGSGGVYLALDESGQLTESTSPYTWQYIRFPAPTALLPKGVYQLQTSDGTHCLTTTTNDEDVNILQLYEFNTSTAPDTYPNNQTWWFWDPDYCTLETYKQSEFISSRVRLILSPAGVLSTVDVLCDPNDDTCTVYTGDMTGSNIFGLSPTQVLNLANNTTLNMSTLKFDTGNSNNTIKAVRIDTGQSVLQMYATNGGSPTIPVPSDLICSMNQPTTGPPYNQANEPGCCAGIFDAGKINQLSTAGTLDPSVIYLNLASNTSLNKWTGISNVAGIDVTLPLYIRTSDGNPQTYKSGVVCYGPPYTFTCDSIIKLDGSSILVRVVSVANSDGKQICVQTDLNCDPPNGTFGCTPQTSYLGATTASSIFQYTPAIDASKCAPTWCPWSGQCQTDTLASANYCAGLDSDGYPLLNTDINCGLWAKANPKNLGTVSQQFCTTYPSHPACQCQYFINTPTYANIKSIFNAVDPQVCPTGDCQIIPDPVCWAGPCTLSPPDLRNATLYSDEQLAKRASSNGCNMTLTICQQIIDAQTVAGNINIDGNTFKQVCGTVLPPGPSPSSAPPAPPPIPPFYPPSSLPSFIPAAVAQWIQQNTTVFVIVVILIVLLFVWAMSKIVESYF
jgi:hypothetical protein